MFGAAFFGKEYLGASYFGPAGSAPGPVVVVVDGSGIRLRRRHTPARAKDRLPEDIRREQFEDERYLAELEKNALQPPATERRGKTGDQASDQASETTTTVAPLLPDAIARAASAEQVVARARASSAEVLAKAKADERRRTALLLLMLD